VLVKQDEETLRQAVSEHEGKENLKTTRCVDADTQAGRRSADCKDVGDLLDGMRKFASATTASGHFVWKSVCNGCHMNIPPQMYNEVQRSEALLSCPNCNGSCIRGSEKSLVEYGKRKSKVVYRRRLRGIRHRGAGRSSPMNRTCALEGRAYLAGGTNNIAEYQL
jgi:NAD-dependent SIR2 family protein deacetylase